MRHDRCAEHADSGVDAGLEAGRGGAVERRDQGCEDGFVPVGVYQEDFEAVAKADDGDHGDDAAFEPQMPPELEGENGEHKHGRDERGKEKRSARAPAVGVKDRAEQQVEPDGSAQELGKIGGDGGDFGGRPQGVGDGPAEVGAAVLGQREAGDNTQLGREKLDQDGHGVGPQQHPKQTIAELRAALDIGGEVPGIDVSDRSDEGRAEETPEAGASSTLLIGTGVLAGLVGCAIEREIQRQRQ